MNLTYKKINEIKQLVESSDSFKYWNQEIGLTFEDFNIIDKESGLTLKDGKKDIGYYWIYLESGEIYGVGYDMNCEAVRKHNIKEIA